jgi:hypothetical protein
MRADIWLDECEYSRIEIRRVNRYNPPPVVVYQDGKGQVTVYCEGRPVYDERLNDSFGVLQGKEPFRREEE